MDVDTMKQFQDIFGEMADDAAFIQNSIPDSNSMETISKLIQHQINLESEILQIETQLSKYKAEHYKVSEIDIPDKFKELGIESFTMADGSKVEVKKYYAASIKEEDKEKAFTWLRNNNLDDVIKHEIKVVFGKGEDTACEELKEELLKLNVNYTDKEHVHPQTLKAMVRDQLEKMGGRLSDDEKFPTDIFGVFIGYKTKINKKRRV